MESSLLALAIPAIIGTVNLLKALEVKGKALTLLSVFVGALFVFGAQVLPDGLGRMIYLSILGGLGAAGIWDLTKLFSGAFTTVTTTQQITPSVQVATAVKVDPELPIVADAQPHN